MEQVEETRLDAGGNKEPWRSGTEDYRRESCDRGLFHCTLWWLQGNSQGAPVLSDYYSRMSHLA